MTSSNGWSPLYWESKKELYTLSDLDNWTPPKVYRVIDEGVLNVQGKLLIFGAEGSWKSMLALHLSHALATGGKWLGFSTSRCNVVRIQVEMPMYQDKVRTDKYRMGTVQVYVAKHTPQGFSNEQLSKVEEDAAAYSAPSNVVSANIPSIHIDESFGRKKIIDYVGICKAYLPDLPIVVILDPLYKTIGKDINDQTVMGNTLNFLDEDMRTYDFTMVIVHHARKSQPMKDMFGRLTIANMGSEDATGSRYIANWADTILRVDPNLSDKTDTHYNLLFTKHRYAEDILPEVKLRWNKTTLHPQILSRTRHQDESDFKEIRTKTDFAQLE